MEGDFYLDNDKKFKLARAYVPIQVMSRVYDPKEALKHGTLFPELYQPYKTYKDRDLGGQYYG